jgi:hypothetical protein
VPSFSSCFHLACPGGTEHATWEHAAAEDRKRLKWKKALKHMGCQKRGDSLSDDDDEDSKGEDKDLAALQSALDVSRGSSNDARLSGASCPAGVTTEESST